MKDKRDNISTAELKERIAAHGMKCTSQRIAIYNAMLQLRHPSAEEVYHSIENENPSISLSTVYNSLETFANNKLIGKLMTRDGKKRYCGKPEPHAHLCYEDSGELIDYFDPSLQECITGYFEINSIPDFAINDVQIIITGKRC